MSYNPEVNEEEEEFESTFSFVSSLSGVLCVVDCSEEMLFKDEETGLLFVREVVCLFVTIVLKIYAKFHDHVTFL